MEERTKRKLAVLLPGIGYTCDRPLLYYGGKLAQAMGWEVVRVNYGGFPPKVRGDLEKMMQCAQMAIEQTEDALGETDFGQYDDTIFLSKSVGTVVAAAYAHMHGLHCCHVLFTPVEPTFSYPIRRAVAFHGTADPWAETPLIQSLCRKARIPLYITENANHSLETGDVMQDVENLKTVMGQVKAFLALPDEI